jgi:hypothetical protein
VRKPYSYSIRYPPRLIPDSIRNHSAALSHYVYLNLLLGASWFKYSLRGKSATLWGIPPEVIRWNIAWTELRTGTSCNVEDQNTKRNLGWKTVVNVYLG